MKIRNYEKKQGILLFGIGLFLLEVGVFLLLWRHKVFCYRRISGVFVKENLVLLMLSSRDRKLLYQNHSVLFQSKKQSYQIEEDRGVLFEKEGIRYYEILLKMKIPKEKKANDLLELSIREKKERILKIFKNTWGR